MTDLPRLPADASHDKVIQALDEYGAVIIENLLPADLLADINQCIDPLIDSASMTSEINEFVDMFFGERVRHITGLAGRSTRFAEELMCHPLFMALCDHMLLPSCSSYQLNLAHLMDRGPGSERQMIHRDQDVWVHYCSQRATDNNNGTDNLVNDIQVASIIALVDFTKENGATCVVPGSHKWDYQREAKESEVAYAEMSAGSAVIYRGSTLHAGGGNTTADTWRRGIHMSYCLGWFRTEENNILTVPPAKAKLLSKRAQELLGYGIHDAMDAAGGFLGAVNMRHPTALLSENKL